MASSIVQPYKGALVLDIQHLSNVVVDVVPGATRGLRREKEGWARVDKELSTNVPFQAELLGVAPDIYARVERLTEQLGSVREAQLFVSKLAQVLDETEIVLEDEREGVVATVVDAARRTAKRKDPTVLAAFEQTIRYHGQVALRAAKTRRRNAEGTEEESESQADAAE
ncbi:hypothetical protein [Chondromyces crocatus]|uniref:Uncharacterized protein n=1 Tax=Chondromyces crocatus TaxID=52 RepID=A0A0K1ECX8_CHOCO|nr:hypothetical protein [Chondromyces crocatus]AKT38725.1 uncharacterized protein CMC5_028690 [Chondromyces crocatus]